MKRQLLFTVVCLAIYAEARFAKRDTEEVSSTAAPNPKDCCYPRPPRKRDMQRCCEIPLDEMYDNLTEEIKQCKEDMKKKKDEVTEAPSSTVATVEEANIADLEVDDSNEIDDSPSTTVAPTTEGRGPHGRHHNGKGHGKHRGPKGKCVKAVMEKRGWAKDGHVDFDAILRDTEKASNTSVEVWIPIFRDAINMCKKQPQPEFQDGQKKHYVPEKAAFRCMKNNAMMHCPDFPENDEYCVALREVYQRCGARKQPGRRRFEWCEGRKSKPRDPA